MTDTESESGSESAEQELFHADRGSGPLLQRDYWAVLTGGNCSPEDLVSLIARDFGRFSPASIASFTRESNDPLCQDGEMKVLITGYGECHVRVVHCEPRSLTMRTLGDHYEAGRITLGAFYDEAGQLVFKVRSRARVRSRLHFWSFALFGHKFQEQMWVGFIQNLAEACGAQIEGEVQSETQEVEADLADLGELNTPTFVAR